MKDREGRFKDKEAARQHVWDLLQERGQARFPYPPHGRIPNFTGARAAAERLFRVPFWGRVRRIKVNPDAPQRPVRELALRRGITVLLPTPRLRGGFLGLDPAVIPDPHVPEAASLSKCRRWAEEVPLRDLPELDAIVCGSVAVSRDGRRCGKGEGYSDLEYGILRELGHPPVPVATTVHPLQLVGGLPREETDLPVRWIVTPEEAIEVQGPPPPPAGIRWDLLDRGALDSMPVLQELAQARDGAAGGAL